MATNKFLDGIVNPETLISKTASAAPAAPAATQENAAEVFGQLCKVANAGAQAAVVEWAKQNPDLAPTALGQLMAHFATNA